MRTPIHVDPRRVSRVVRDSLPVALIIFVWLVALGWLLPGFQEFRLSDQANFVARASALDVFDRRSLVDPFYPWGYPALLRMVAAWTHDYLRAAQILSMLGGALTLAAVGVTATVAYGTRGACLAVGWLSLTSTFDQYALMGTTDVPALGWTWAAGAALVCVLRSGRRTTAAVSGACLGVAYLIRYTSVVLLPIGALILLVGRGRRTRIAAGDAVAFVVAFVVMAAPQLVPTALETGNPFWTRQDVNVYFGVHGHFDWVNGWPDALAHANGVWRVFADAPREFVSNMVRNARAMLRLVDASMAVLAGLGVVLLRREDVRAVSVIALATTAFAAALSMAFVTDRLVLPLLPGLALLAGYALAGGRFRSARVLQTTPALAAGALVVALAHTSTPAALATFVAPTAITTVSRVLRQAGVAGPREVLSLDHELYYAGTAIPVPFAHPMSVAGPPADSLDHLRQLMRAAGARYLVATDRSTQSVPALRSWWPSPLPVDFHELYADPGGLHARVWRVDPPTPSANWQARLEAALRDLDARPGRDEARVRRAALDLVQATYGNADSATSPAPRDLSRLDDWLAALDGMDVFLRCCDQDDRAGRTGDRIRLLRQAATPAMLSRHAVELQALQLVGLYRVLQTVSDDQLRQAGLLP